VISYNCKVNILFLHAKASTFTTYFINNLMRDRTHDRELIQKETGLEEEFITRMLFIDSY